jgi:alpha-beta hydrolase superfamily lysophospholipase
LSQWSLDDANADGVRAGSDITVPALVVANSADNACPPSYTRALYDALASEDKTALTIEGANHYYIGEEQRPLLRHSAQACTRWLAERELAPARAAVE